jgi:serine protease Do
MTGAVVVTDVAAGSQAAKKGVRAGDVIVSVSDVPIKKPEDVQDRLEALMRDGTKTAFALLKNPDGIARFVVVGLSAPN